MSQEINFDAIVARPIKVTKGGMTYELRDDVPMAVMIRYFDLQELRESMQREINAFNPALSTAQEATALLHRLFSEVETATLALFGDLWRHTSAYREMTNETLADLFTVEDQMQVISAFFTARSAISTEPSAATPTDGPTAASPSDAAEAEPVPATRGAARQQREAKRRRE